MPYKSQAQRGKFHAMEERGEISPKVVHEFDEASKGMKLPKKVKKHADADLKSNDLSQTAEAVGTKTERATKKSAKTKGDDTYGHQVNAVPARSTWDQDRDAKFERESKRK